MTTVALIHEAFSKGISDVRAGADRLRRDRDTIDRQVSGFLGAGWTGVAADAQQEAHQEWTQGMLTMREALADLRTAARTAHENYTGAAETHVSMWDQLR